MEQSQTKVLTAHVSVEMAEKIDGQADCRHQMILQGLADVDKNRVVKHVDVLKWVNSLNSETPFKISQSKNIPSLDVTQKHKDTIKCE